MSPQALEARLWYWQRISAMVLALCVLVHLATMIYAVRGGLSAAEVLGRTRGNWAFGAFYGVFILACAVHVPIGISNILEEWLGLSRRLARILAALFALKLLVLGAAAMKGLLLP